MKTPTFTGMEIAIVGLAARLPGAGDVEELWRNLRDGVESIVQLPEEALREAGVDSALLADPRYVRAQGVLAGIDRFDAAFFGYSPREAEILDPQHRLFLECAWAALEDAGYEPGMVRGTAGATGGVGVFGGTGTSGYFLNNLARNAALLRSIGGFQAGIGNEKDHLATRVSYELGLEGPAVTVQTACSTSLVAVHLACQALLAGDCQLALAGGVSIAVPHGLGYLYEEGGILSPDGHCRAFDERAQGCVGGSGAGIVVLKRLEAALADGDAIRAVIKGSAVNNDGSGKVGYTAPGLTGQARVIRRAQRMAEVDPASVTYVEAHGTGTALGDPIEIAALTRAFRAGTKKTAYCAVGSVKTNVGHLDAAAGVAGLIKTVLALQHRQLPPSLHFQRPNPRLELDGSPFYVNAELAEWRSEGPRRAGVSSFGIGGTNAHVVLEEAPEQAVREAASARPWHLFVLSAKTPAALEAVAGNLASHLRRHPGAHSATPADIAWTLQTGRKPFDHRRAAVARDLEELASELEGPGGERALAAGSVAFLFPGQGAQHPGMAAELYATEPVFRAELDRCADLLAPHLGCDLRRLIHPEPGADAGEAARQLADTRFTQPALFAVEYALARLWMDWGIQPTALLGHSIGEYVAACLSGVLSLEDALRLVALRGRLVAGLPRGTMLSVPLSESEVLPLLDVAGGALALAAVNGPELCVVSGPEAEAAALEARLRAAGVDVTRLHTSHAFHSGMLDPILDELRREVAKVTPGEPRIPYLSNLTGTWITAAESADPDYWVRHLRQTVRFADGLAELLHDPSRALLEVGPGGKLAGLAAAHPRRDPAQLVLASLPHPRRPEGDARVCLEVAGRLWLAGLALDWPKLHAGERRYRVPLPTYPFERRRYWVEPDARPAAVAAELPAPALPTGRKADLEDWLYVPLWKQSVPPDPGATAGGADGVAVRWLLFVDDEGLGAELAARLELRGGSVVQVRAGDEFERLGEKRFTVAPRRREDYSRLLAELDAGGGAPRRIVHLWGVDPTPGAADGERERCLDRGFFGLLGLAQALGEQALARGGAGALAGLRIDVVSTQVQRVGGDEDLIPEKATVLGPCRIIPREYPGVACRSIDVALPAPGSRARDLLLERLAAEVMGEAEEPLLAYRGGQRWVQVYEPARPLTHGQRPPRLRDEGVYLITGGLGGVGLVLAGHLAATARARLALVSRSPLPPRAEWARHAGAGGETGRRVRALLELEETGAEVLVVQADVTDAAAVRRAVAETRARFGAIHGVVHAAGDPPAGIIQLKTHDAAAAVLAAKVRGTRVLEAALADEPELDFFALCSSLSAVLGEPGRVDYAAANAFLDTFALRQAAPGRTFTVSIGWDGWSDVGMSARRAPESEADRAALADALSPDEGIAVFRRVLSGHLPHVIVSTRDLAVRLEESRALSAAELLARLEEERRSRPLHPRPALAVAYAAPECDAERLLAGIWQDLLGIETVGIDDDFFELGGDSLIGLQVVARAGEAGIKLSVGQLFEHPTVRALAAAVLAAATEVGGGAGEQGPVAGPVPLTPIQAWFFAQGFAEPHHWNQSQLLELREPLEPPVLAAAVAALGRRHDALRLRFEPVDGGWVQRAAGGAGDSGEEVPFAWIDLSALSGESFRTAVETAAERLQGSLDLARGPVFRVALFTAGAAPGRLLLVAHHLTVDVVSWGVLLEDLQALYRSRGRETGLPPAASFTRWASWLAGHAAAGAMEYEAGFWLEQGRRPVAPLPVDLPGGLDTAGSVRTMTVALDAEETRRLLRQVPASGRAQVQEVLLAAFARTLSSWTGASAHRIDLEGHGREDLGSGLDVSRTVGWFTALYPVVLDLDGVEDAASALAWVQRQLREIPGRGMGYGLLSHLGDPALRRDLSALPSAEAVFAYLGDMGEALAETAPLRPAAESAGPACSPRGLRSHSLAVNAVVVQGRMTTVWMYSANLHRPETIGTLARVFLEELGELLAVCLDDRGEIFSPLDFADSGLSEAQLESLLATYSDPEI